jgi:hypothetical protein
MEYTDSDYRNTYGTSPAENAALLVADWGSEVALRRAASALADAERDLTEEQAQTWLGRDAKYWAAIKAAIEKGVA